MTDLDAPDSEVVISLWVFSFGTLLGPWAPLLGNPRYGPELAPNRPSPTKSLKSPDRPPQFDPYLASTKSHQYWRIMPDRTPTKSQVPPSPNQVPTGPQQTKSQIPPPFRGELGTGRQAWPLTSKAKDKRTSSHPKKHGHFCERGHLSSHQKKTGSDIPKVNHTKGSV